MAQIPIQLALDASAPAYSLALSVVVIGILLSGLALGISRALGSRKLWAWGAEELMQSVINAALLGAFAAACSASGALLMQASQAGAIGGCDIIADSQNAPLEFSICSIDRATSQSEQIALTLASSSFRLGMLSGIELDLGAIRATPFDSLAYPAKAYSDWAYGISGIGAALHAQRQMLQTIAQTGFSLFLPAGLVLRMFFGSRKLGGAIMAGAIGFYIIYPLVFASLVRHSGLEDSGLRAAKSLEDIDRRLSPLPQLDFRKSGEIANLVISLDGGNVSAQTYMPYPRMSEYLGSLEAYAYFYPIIALAISIAGIWQLAAVLGGEFRLDLLSEV